MDKEEFDELFDRVFDESVKNHNFVPNSDSSWDKVQTRLKKRDRRKRRMRMLPYVASSFLLGAVIFGTPTATNAFQPLYKAFTSITDGVVEIVFGSTENESTTKPLTAPPPPDDGSPSNLGHDVGTPKQTQTQASYGTWEEAASEVAFLPPAIQYVPDGFKLNQVQVSYPSSSEKANTAILIYTSDNNNIYNLTLRKLQPNEKLKSGSNGNGVQFQKITIQGNEAFLMTTEEGTGSLEFLREDVYVSIVGSINEDEAVRIAEGLYGK